MRSIKLPKSHKSTVFILNVIFMFIIVTMTSIIGISLYMNYSMNKRYEQVIKNSLEVQKLKEYSFELVDKASIMITNNSNEEINKFNEKWLDIEKICDSLDEKVYSDQSIQNYKIVKNLLVGIKKDCNDAIIYNESENMAFKSPQMCSLAEKKSEYLHVAIGDLLLSEVNYMKVIQEKMSKIIYKMIMFCIAFVLIITILIVIVSSTFSKTMQKRFDKLTCLAKEMSYGNFKLENLDAFENIANDTQNEFDILESNFINMKKSINFLLCIVKESADDISESASDLSIYMEQSRSGNDMVIESINSVNYVSNIQSEIIEDLFSKISKTNCNIQNIIENVQALKNNVNHNYEFTKNGKESLNTMIGQVSHVNEILNIFKKESEQLKKSSSEISNVIGVVSEITQQTNLLALNASIEAARFGEAGKGFGVVADEVRRLAEQSNKATENISKIIKNMENITCKINSDVEISQKAIDENSVLSEKVIKDFEQMYSSSVNINTNINNMIYTIENIGGQIEDIKELTGKINDNSETLLCDTEKSSSVTEEQLSIIDEVNEQSNTLSNLSEKLTESIEQFSL